MKAANMVAEFDSASAFLRATANFLHGRDFPALGLTGPARSLEYLVPLVNLLPQKARETVYSYGGWQEAHGPRKLAGFRSEDFAKWAAGLYPPGPYPAIAIGSSNGAMVHLCAALGIPWLPQTVLLPVRQTGIPPDDPAQAMARGRVLAEPMLDANPDLQLHHMHDPVQDRLMVRGMMYFRVKRRILGEAYRRFIAENLAPGGTLISVECDLSWPSTHVAERHFFQFGGFGGPGPSELFGASPRIAAFLERRKAPVRAWTPPPADCDCPEAEWGFEPRLLDELLDLAHRDGYRLDRLRFPEPQALSPFVADLYARWYNEWGRRSPPLLAESFILIEPYWALRTGCLPYWMVFNTEDSAAGLERFLAKRRKFDTIHMNLFSNGLAAPGQAPIERWQAILAQARKQGKFLGIDAKAYPADFASLGRVNRALRALPDRYALPAPISLDALRRFANARRHLYPVEWRTAS